MTVLKQHPLSKLFPPMSPEEFQELVADIQRQGVLEPIELLDGMVLDGWNRYTACQQIGIDCPSRTWTSSDGDDAAFVHVWAKNALRRHLTSAQRLSIVAAAHPEQWAVVGTEKTRLPDAHPVMPAARRLGAIASVNEEDVRRAKRLERDAPDLWQRAVNGDLSLSAANNQRIARELDQRKQQQKAHTEQKQMEWKTHFVKEVIARIDAIQSIQQDIHRGLAYERFSPEAKPFLSLRLEKAQAWLAKAREELSK